MIEIIAACEALIIGMLLLRIKNLTKKVIVMENLLEEITEFVEENVSQHKGIHAGAYNEVNDIVSKDVI